MKRALAFCALIAVAGGCFNDSTAPQPTTIHGRWVLKSIDGEPIPQVYTEVTNFKLEIMNGSLTLREDGTFSDSTDLRRTENQLPRRLIDVAEGTFTMVRDTLRLSSSRGEHYFMLFSKESVSQSFSQNLGGKILLYRR